MLHIQEEECTPPEVELKEPKRVFVKAARTMKRDNSVPMAGDSRSANTVGGLHSYFTPKRRASEPREPEEPMPKEEEKENATKKVFVSVSRVTIVRVDKQLKAKVPIWKGKSLWVGRDNEAVNVEIRVLQYYESLGFKGCAVSLLFSHTTH